MGIIGGKSLHRPWHELSRFAGGWPSHHQDFRTIEVPGGDAGQPREGAYVIEFPEEPRASSSSPSNGAGRAAYPATEAELWLRRELAFLHRVERRILRRAHWRREAWRLAAVGSILAVFALCWYLAAAATGSTTGSCAGKTSATAAAHGSTAQQTSDQGSSTHGSGTTSTTKTTSGTAASCGS